MVSASKLAGGALAFGRVGATAVTSGVSDDGNTGGAAWPAESSQGPPSALA